MTIGLLGSVCLLPPRCLSFFLLYCSVCHEQHHPYYGCPFCSGRFIMILPPIISASGARAPKHRRHLSSEMHFSHIASLDSTVVVLQRKGGD